MQRFLAVFGSKNNMIKYLTELDILFLLFNPSGAECYVFFCPWVSPTVIQI
jgi:hypothetical protein